MSKFKSILTAAKDKSGELELKPAQQMETLIEQTPTEVETAPIPTQTPTREDSQPQPTEQIPTQPPQTSEPKQMGRPKGKGKRSNPDYEQVTAYIKSATYNNVKIELLKEGKKREFSELVQEMLDDWLQGRR
ncbi:MAG: hypothetical protein IGS39_16115 [Calothrix sp. C42_A2020_038]|nr:hypothetical protein [Calothrix sp. C42_A2020_038]